MSQHHAAILFEGVVGYVDQHANHATAEERAEFWTMFAASAMGQLAALVGQEGFAEFMAKTEESAQKLFATARRIH